ncbi:MAG: hypothetical protein KJP23_24225 [Deltaproteobacteria bacterium]|nr:hypothetical protein [Deltaproteobacteria bacterium]
MFESLLLPLISYLFVLLVIHFWMGRRNLVRNKTLTPFDDLWKLKQITGKSEYEIFHIAAAEKGWPEYQVEKHFKRYLNDQSLPGYVKAFLRDGQEYIRAYRGIGGDFFNKKRLVFYALFTLVIIGGSLMLSNLT